jgi:hypoxanthine phosphoribosyltransferase
MSYFQAEDYFDILISGNQVRTRCQELAKTISSYYGDEPVVAVGILRGCCFFHATLLPFLTCPVLIDFMFVSSYGDALVSSGSVKIERDLQTDISGKHVLLIDDIVDTGSTLSNLVETLKVRKPKSVEICTMLDKDIVRTSPVDIRFSAFPIPNHFVVGFGLDYRQCFRNMDFVGKLKDGKQGALDEVVEKIRNHG